MNKCICIMSYNCKKLELLKTIYFVVDVVMPCLPPFHGHQIPYLTNVETPPFITIKPIPSRSYNMKIKTGLKYFCIRKCDHSPDNCAFIILVSWFQTQHNVTYLGVRYEIQINEHWRKGEQPPKNTFVILAWNSRLKKDSGSGWDTDHTKYSSRVIAPSCQNRNLIVT